MEKTKYVNMSMIVTKTVCNFIYYMPISLMTFLLEEEYKFI
jgi:hypothetical protein